MEDVIAMLQIVPRFFELPRRAGELQFERAVRGVIVRVARDHANPQLLQRRAEIRQRRARLHAERGPHGATRPPRPMLQRTHATEHENHQRAGAERFHVIAGSHGRSDRGHRPDRRRRGKASDRALGMDDRARTQKAHAGYDLRRDARDISVRVPVGRETNVTHGDGQVHEQRRANANQNVGPQTGGLAGNLPIEADRAAEQHRHQQLEQQFDVERREKCIH